MTAVIRHANARHLDSSVLPSFLATDRATAVGGDVIVSPGSRRHLGSVPMGTSHHRGHDGQDEQGHPDDRPHEVTAKPPGSQPVHGGSG